MRSGRTYARHVWNKFVTKRVSIWAGDAGCGCSLSGYYRLTKEHKSKSCVVATMSSIRSTTTNKVAATDHWLPIPWCVTALLFAVQIRHINFASVRTMELERGHVMLIGVLSRNVLLLKFWWCHGAIESETEQL